jgi:hypothetical protein
VAINIHTTQLSTQHRIAQLTNYQKHKHLKEKTRQTDGFSHIFVISSDQTARVTDDQPEENVASD